MRHIYTNKKASIEYQCHVTVSIPMSMLRSQKIINIYENPIVHYFENVHIVDMIDFVSLNICFKMPTIILLNTYMYSKFHKIIKNHSKTTLLLSHVSINSSFPRNFPPKHNFINVSNFTRSLFLFLPQIMKKGVLSNLDIKVKLLNLLPLYFVHPLFLLYQTQYKLFSVNYHHISPLQNHN